MRARVRVRGRGRGSTRPQPATAAMAKWWMRKEGLRRSGTAKHLIVSIAIVSI